jgi:hypothetical protein
MVVKESCLSRDSLQKQRVHLTKASKGWTCIWPSQAQSCRYSWFNKISGIRVIFHINIRVAVKILVAKGLSQVPKYVVDVTDGPFRPCVPGALVSLVYPAEILKSLILRKLINHGILVSSIQRMFECSSETHRHEDSAPRLQRWY